MGAPVSMRVAIVGSSGGWHAERLERALTARGHECGFAPVTRMVARIDGGVAVNGRELALDACDVVIVRGIPRGSLEQIVFRVDVLHALAAVGVRAVNGAPAIERTVDKFLASALIAAGRGCRRRGPWPASAPGMRWPRSASSAATSSSSRSSARWVRDGARRRPGRRPAGVPRAGGRAGRLLPAGDVPHAGVDVRAWWSATA